MTDQIIPDHAPAGQSDWPYIERVPPALHCAYCQPVTAAAAFVVDGTSVCRHHYYAAFETARAKRRAQLA